MGSLSGAVLIGFLALHVAEILIIISFSTPEWSVGNPQQPNTSHPVQNETEQSKGLWEFCVEKKNCSKLNVTAQPSWFKAVEGLETAGVALGIFALIITYAMYCTASCNNSSRAAVLNTGAQILTGFILMTGLIIFGLKARTDDDSGDFDADFDIKFGWSFYVNIAGTALTWLSAAMTLRGACYFIRRESGYENI